MKAGADVNDENDANEEDDEDDVGVREDGDENDDENDDEVESDVGADNLIADENDGTSQNVAAKHRIRGGDDDDVDPDYVKNCYSGSVKYARRQVRLEAHVSAPTACDAEPKKIDVESGANDARIPVHVSFVVSGF